MEERTGGRRALPCSAMHNTLPLCPCSRHVSSECAGEGSLAVPLKEPAGPALLAAVAVGVGVAGEWVGLLSVWGVRLSP